MSDSTTILNLISANQAQKEGTANALFDAASPAMMFGRNARACSALTWGIYGGVMMIAGTPTVIANQTVALTASTTNYLYVTAAGVLTKVTTLPTGWPGPITNPLGAIALYKVITGSATFTSYEDRRVGIGPQPWVPTTHTIAYAASLTIDTATFDIFDITLTGNLTLGFSNGVDGKMTNVRFKQDGTGSHVLTHDSSVRVGTDIATTTLTTGANKLDYIGYRYNSAAAKFDVVSLIRGF